MSSAAYPLGHKDDLALDIGQHRPRQVDAEPALNRADVEALEPADCLSPIPDSDRVGLSADYDHSILRPGAELDHMNISDPCHHAANVDLLTVESRLGRRHHFLLPTTCNKGHDASKEQRGERATPGTRRVITHDPA